MALIKCNECGQMISDKAEVCPNCGSNVSVQITESTEDKPKRKKPVRHGFVTFWLFLNMIGSVLAAIGIFFFTEELYGYVDPKIVKWLAIAYLGSAFACYNIYEWKKKGFWTFLAWTGVSVLFSSIMLEDFAYGDIINALILWGVLQIPSKESGSCWRNLK